MTETGAKDRIERAVSEREEAMASLHRDDGTRRFADGEHEERLAAIEREHAAEFDAIEADAERSISRAEEDLLKIEHADPSGVLDLEELGRANSRRAFVAGDCAALPLDALEKRCRAVLASGDRVGMFLYTHHAALRVGEAPRADHRDASGSRDEEGAVEVREAVSKLVAGLDPGRERKLGRAREALEEAQRLRRDAYYGRRGASGPADLYRQQKYSRTA